MKYTILQGKPVFKAKVGDTCFVLNESKLYEYDGAKWHPYVDEPTTEKTPSTPKKGTRKKKVE